MLHEDQLVYGLVVAVDVEGFSRMGILDQVAVLFRLKEVLDRAAERAGLDRAEWLRQPRGDGELAVLPADSDVSRVVADFVHEVVEELGRGSRPRLRLRISMHHGALTAGVFGPVGDALIVACRLLDAESVRETLARHIGEDVVMVVSERLYEDVVATGFRGLRPDRFQPVADRVKGRTFRGYVCVGSPKPAVPAAGQASSDWVVATSQANPSGSVNGAAELTAIRCAPVPSGATPACLARALRR